MRREISPSSGRIEEILIMYKHFLNCEISREEMLLFIASFNDGIRLGFATFEFHNDEEFRIYIDSGTDGDIMLTFKVEN